MNKDVNDNSDIALSSFTQSLLQMVRDIKADKQSMQGEPIEVSAAASFFAVAYENLRSSIEYNEAHIIRRSAIERILKRRLSVNVAGTGEGLNLVRELLWARQAPKKNFTTADALNIQHMINQHLFLKNQVSGWSGSFDYIIYLLACEVENFLDVQNRQIETAFLFYFFQTSHTQIKITGIDEATADRYYYVACEKELRKNDDKFIQYHLLKEEWGDISSATERELSDLAIKLKDYFLLFDKTIHNPYSDKLSRLVRKQLPSYRILFEIITSHPRQVFTNRESLNKAIDAVCRQKYEETRQKLKVAGMRSIVYIFVTKMLLVGVLEIPLTLFLYRSLHFFPTLINTTTPPLLMALIVTTTRPPSNKNTEQINTQILNIIEPYLGVSSAQHLISIKTKERRPVLTSIFYSTYTILFILFFVFLYGALDGIGFNLINKGIFVLFISLVTFFGYRVRQISREYALSIEDHVWTPFVDTFFLPIMSVGKVLSAQVSKLNILMFVLDVIIEAPLKVVIELIEEWRDFTKKKKEELI